VSSLLDISGSKPSFPNDNAVSNPLTRLSQEGHAGGS
jgi:hypothetical protein